MFIVIAMRSDENNPEINGLQDNSETSQLSIITLKKIPFTELKINVLSSSDRNINSSHEPFVNIYW